MAKWVNEEKYEQGCALGNRPYRMDQNAPDEPVGVGRIKLGGDDKINDGAEALKELASKIDPEKMKKPSFMMVLIGVGTYAYRREDGVFVVPVGCLKD